MNELLARRERLGVRLGLSLNLVLMGFFVVVTLSSAQSTFEVVSTLALIGVGLVFNLVFLWFNFQGRLVGFSGWFNTLLYLAIATALPYIWYSSVGGTDVPRTYLLKISILPLDFLVLVLCCLPGRPWYPAVFTVGATVGLLGLMGYALTDPRVQLTDLILASTQGPGANLPLLLSNLAEFFVAGLLLTVFLHRFQRTVVEASEAEHATAQLGRYFSPGVVGLIAKSEAGFLKPGGQLQTVTVLFSDIRGFTTLSEGMEPARVVEWLSLYQEQMVEAIFAHGGTLDKFIGDGIMATFGTPYPSPDDSLRAVRAALAMEDKLVRLNERLAAQGLPALRHGIGLHTGPVIAGNVGTEARLEYTVIGDTVNTASRIETLCKSLGDTLLVSEQVIASLAERPSEWAFPARGQVELKGKSQRLAVHAVSVVRSAADKTVQGL